MIPPCFLGSHIWFGKRSKGLGGGEMLPRPIKTDQGEQGEDPGKYDFSPYLVDVSWTFHGLTSLWSLMTMTEGVSAPMSQTIWLLLPSRNYSSDDHQWPCHWGQWTLVLSLVSCGAGIDPCFLSLSLLFFLLLIPMFSVSFAGSFSSLVFECWCPPRAVLHSLFTPHILSNFETLSFLSSPIVCLSSIFSIFF